MKLTKLGVLAMCKSCPWCSAPAGSLCTGEGMETPLSVPDYWEHGVHYKRLGVERGEAIALPKEEPAPEDWMMAKLSVP